MWDLERDHARVEDVQIVGQNVVADDAVGIDVPQARHDGGEERALRIEVGDNAAAVQLANLALIPLLALLLETHRKGLIVNAINQSNKERGRKDLSASRPLSLSLSHPSFNETR